MISRVTIDKSTWPAGAWSTEPDTAAWLETPILLPCLVERMDWGALNGYVGVPTSHKLHGRGYDDGGIVDVHGGLTFAGRFRRAGAHELFDDPRVEPTDPIGAYWWFGFDTSHAGDFMPNTPMGLGRRGTYRNFDYVVTEVKRLADQIYRSQHPLEYLARVDLD